jgi:hypothetical protein
MSECKCSMRERLVGDGCQACNPQMTIDCLVEQLADIATQRDELLAALKPFAALLQPHNAAGLSTTPIFGINDATITRGDLIEAARVVAKIESQL